MEDFSTRKDVHIEKIFSAAKSGQISVLLVLYKDEIKWFKKRGFTICGNNNSEPFNQTQTLYAVFVEFFCPEVAGYSVLESKKLNLAQQAYVAYLNNNF